MMKGCLLVAIATFLLCVTVLAAMFAIAYPDGRLLFGMIAGWGVVLLLVLFHIDRESGSD